MGPLLQKKPQEAYSLFSCQVKCHVLNESILHLKRAAGVAKLVAPFQGLVEPQEGSR